EQQIQGFSYFISAGAVAIYGGGDGRDWDMQKAALKNQADIIIATPGKLLSHLKMGDVKFDKIKHLILDEADKMLDMGFIEDISMIISHLPQQRQTLMFSATMPNSIRQLAKKILVNPEEISLSMSKPAEGVDQKVYLVEEEHKVKLINHVLAERKDYESILVFTSTKSKVSEIVSSLSRNGLPAQGISSNLEQDEREEVLRKFHARLIRILVATDVMSRGIDVKEINMVINYDLPHDAEDYVHRVGRTARVNAKGEAVTLVTHREMYRLKKIEQLIEATIPKLQPPFPVSHVHRKEEPRHASNKHRQFHGKKKNFSNKNRGRKH
ncbi:MAG TPA: DEAD/DEAH box helicase, partial [Cyclobacteriaceae bacterium]|nr:DEAD/DEAH box helicase [Cyclobacteriaceae bacterium]